MNCPVCNLNCEHSEHTIDEEITQIYTTCPTGHYSFEYIYGVYRQTIGVREWRWTWQRGEEEQKRISEEICRHILWLQNQS